ncbi:hypothetical protein F4774DRAFT_415903 [Daldinia eschscholtzii]|nr:hypothetical protein F4774DRAFT_415903 [Daldinia eschscholtzii]
MAQTIATPLRFGDRLSELTTVFTPPCQITWLRTTTKVPSQYPTFPTTGPASCDPPSWVDNISQKGFAYYSPAICPEGFMVGCTASDDRSTEGFPVITAGETAVYCVPNGFTCTSDTTDFRGGVWGFRRTETANGSPVTVGPAIQIRWRDADLERLATDPLMPSAAVFTPTSTTSILLTAATSTSTTGRRQIVTPIPTTSTEVEFDEPSLPIEVEPDPIKTKTEGSPSLPSVPLTSKTSIISPVEPSRTSNADNETAASQNGAEENNSGSATSNTNTAGMALSGILIGIILGYFATRMFRRYRRYRAGKIERFIPFDVSLLASRVFAKCLGRVPSHQTGALERPSRYVDAELGTDGPIPELGSGDPLGTKENPAELSVHSARNSWVSRMSRIFTVKLRKEVWSG